MAEKLLINVAVEETRVALVRSGRLSNLEIDSAKLVEARGNIYKGVIHRVNPSLQAAFVDYGVEKQGFLPVSEIHQSHYPKKLRGQKAPIQDILHNGQELMVQVVKDEIGNKGAGLTTHISMPGRYLVLMAESAKTGISRRLSHQERDRLKAVLDNLPVPEGFGVIVRTAGLERDPGDLQKDLECLNRLWQVLDERFGKLKGPGLIHQERSIALRFIRDYVTTAVDEIICDDEETCEEIRDFCTLLIPEMRTHVTLYDQPTPLFSRYQIEDQIDDIFARRIELPSGGYVIIDQTEALVAIDVNSGRVKTDDIEQTALTSNVEAAAEIARQLRIRDLGGLVVIDFIDMRNKENIRAVENKVRDSFGHDKAKVKFTRISDFGMMEISRQRLKTSLMKGSFDACTHCGGTGQLRSTESSALYVLRRIKETVIRGNYIHATIRMPVDIANYVLNRKRRDLVELETQSNTTINVHGHPECPPTKAAVELLTRSAKARRPKRLLQTFDLVRSVVEKREMDDGEEALFTAAKARGVNLSSDEYSDLYRKIEAEMVAALDLKTIEEEAAQRALRTIHEKVESGALVKAYREKSTAEALSVERTGGLVGLFGKMKNLIVGRPVAPGEERPALEAKDDNKAQRSERGRGRGRDRDRDRSRGRGPRTRPAPITEEVKSTTPTSDEPSRRSRRRRRRKPRAEGEVQTTQEASANPNASERASGSGEGRGRGRRGRGRGQGSRNQGSGDAKPAAREAREAREGTRDKQPSATAASQTAKPAATPVENSGEGRPSRENRSTSRPAKTSTKAPQKEAPKKVVVPRGGSVIDLRGAGTEKRESRPARPVEKKAAPRPEAAKAPAKSATAAGATKKVAATAKSAGATKKAAVAGSAKKASATTAAKKASSTGAAKKSPAKAVGSAPKKATGPASATKAKTAGATKKSAKSAKSAGATKKTASAGVTKKATAAKAKSSKAAAKPAGSKADATAP